MNNYTLLCAAAVAALVCTPASAQDRAAILSFEGVKDHGPIGDYYSGGSRENFGISFSSNALAAIVPQDSGLPKPPSGNTIMAFSFASLTPQTIFMNVADGFEDTVSMSYTPFFRFDSAGTMSVFSGLNGAGDLLASLDLTAQSYDWNEVSLAFKGQGRSIAFAEQRLSGYTNYYYVDDIKLKLLSAAASSVPEPATWISMICGMGIIGGALRSRGHKVAAPRH